MPIATGQTGDAAEVLSLVAVTQTTVALFAVTTSATQQLVVWAKGNMAVATNDHNVYLKYNGVTKDTLIMNPTFGGARMPFALMYSETPGAGTHNITIEGDDTLSNLKLIVWKIGT